MQSPRVSVESWSLAVTWSACSGHDFYDSHTMSPIRNVSLLRTMYNSPTLLIRVFPRFPQKFLVNGPWNPDLHLIQLLTSTQRPSFEFCTYIDNLQRPLLKHNSSSDAHDAHGNNYATRFSFPLQSILGSVRRRRNGRPNPSPWRPNWKRALISLCTHNAAPP
jgi:hypothetical protein